MAMRQATTRATGSRVAAVRDVADIAGEDTRCAGDPSGPCPADDLHLVLLRRPPAVRRPVWRERPPPAPAAGGGAPPRARRGPPLTASAPRSERRWSRVGAAGRPE